MRERRTHPRVKTSRPAVYLPDVYPRPKVCSTVDLSLGGTRLETPYSLEPGERLQISIAIGPRVVKCRGKVVHVLRGADQRSMVGVRFEDLSKQHRGYLREYILKVKEQPDKETEDLLH
jgi:c-di-GMP-binding flagellar brake protein YcgR